MVGCCCCDEQKNDEFSTRKKEILGFELGNVQKMQTLRIPKFPYHKIRTTDLKITQ
jgi:hypothetical protein